MAAATYNCVNASDLDRLKKVAQVYKTLSSVDAVTRAAKTAGEHLKEAMQKTVRGEQTLLSYHDVSDALTVFEDEKNVIVGLPPGHALLSRAEQMEGIYPLTKVVGDLTRQQGDTQEAFLSALAQLVSK